MGFLKVAMSTKVFPREGEASAKAQTWEHILAKGVEQFEGNIRGSGVKINKTRKKDG